MSEGKIWVMGSGGVGWWFVVGLSGSVDPSRIWVADPDTFEGGMGHTRLPTVSNLATKKVAALRGFLIVNFDRRVNVIDGLFSGSEVAENDVVVDCSDADMDAREKIWRKCRRRKARIIRVSYDGKNSTVVVAEGLPFVGTDRTGGYADVPSLALSFMAGGLGAEVVAKQLLQRSNPNHIEFQISLSSLVRGWNGDAEAAEAA